MFGTWHLVRFGKIRISCKTMPRHGIDKFYKVSKSCKTMSRHGIDELL
ncbi:hypothetical protein F383_35777 [Gossypium arboreum]|uniref:Uncharacterized protein n=1 Tax=Gossypium arboreum TaxID=29729 RepID=A0A0B0PZH7_GOSAR|nr:hypothetical protein F383_35777 [Gossypium arboreum]